MLSIRTTTNNPPYKRCTLTKSTTLSTPLRHITRLCIHPSTIAIPPWPNGPALPISLNHSSRTLCLTLWRTMTCSQSGIHAISDFCVSEIFTACPFSRILHTTFRSLPASGFERSGPIFFCLAKSFVMYFWSIDYCIGGITYAHSVIVPVVFAFENPIPIMYYSELSILLFKCQEGVVHIWNYILTVC